MKKTHQGAARAAREGLEREVAELRQEVELLKARQNLKVRSTWIIE